MDEPREPEQGTVSMNELMWNLPLFHDNIYLSMQGQNVMLVDFYIRDLESNLLRVYHEMEGTPVPDALFVSACIRVEPDVDLCFVRIAPDVEAVCPRP